MEYTIEVDVLVTRTYVVEADCPGDALAIYRDGDAEPEDGELFEGNWNEQEHTAKVIDVPACEHAGERCDGAEFCDRCGVQIFSGYKFWDERYCNNHEPETWKAECAAMTEEEFDDQDDIYWTEWEIVDIFCECPQDCQCRPSPEALQVLYDADRARDSQEFDPDNGPCHDCGRVRPDWRSQTNCNICGVGLDWYCVDAHQCNTPQATPRASH